MCADISRKVFLNGVEYIEEKGIGVTKLSRNIAGGMRVVNVFNARAESRESMDNFKKDAAKLVLEAIKPQAE